MQRETKTSEVQILAQLAAGIVSGGIRVVDLTVPLEPATPTIRLPPQFAPSKPFALQEISRYDERGPAWYWNNFECGEHTGTHFDAPVHWVTGKDHPENATHSIPADRFIGPACVIDVSEEVAKNGLASLTNLDQLPAVGAMVIAPPLKIVNGSGSPLRVLALVPG
ncbi:MAG: cyclase family protein [Proteobacteria bacterium]|nr:cyclase family protein [Pseudomonadota bacterium]